MPVRGTYILRRGLYAFIAFLAVLVLNFAIPRLMPGNPLIYFANPHMVSPEQIKLLTQRFGLDKPVWIQFELYLKGIFQWPPDFGLSYKYYPTPVSTVIAEFLPWTLFLVGVSTIITAALGILIGVWTGAKHGSRTDTIATSVSMFLWTMPFFWLGTILLWIFSIYFHWFPAGGAVSPLFSEFGLEHKIEDILIHAFLPALTLILAAFASYALIMRNTMVEELSQDYIMIAVAKGLKNRLVLFRHAARNAMLPMITLIGLNLGYVVSGALLVEIVFSYPGAGWLTYQAVLYHDFPLLQGLFFVLSLTVILANFGADIVYAFIDPRIK